MTRKEKIKVCLAIENEGFDYAFRHYSSFEEVKDEQFHKLRLAYKKAADDLEKYSYINVGELTEKEVYGNE